MRKPIYDERDTGPAFDDVIESDFNPDIIQVALIDMWDAGFMKGIKIGIETTLVSLGFASIIKKVRDYFKNQKD